MAYCRSYGTVCNLRRGEERKKTAEERGEEKREEGEEERRTGQKGEAREERRRNGRDGGGKWTRLSLDLREQGYRSKTAAVVRLNTLLPLHP